VQVESISRSLSPLAAHQSDPALLELPRVSILINNFNYGRFLATSIESALAQTYPRVEIVVVDDASTDGSREVIAEYEGRVKTVLLEENRGQGAAFNAGFAASLGDIVIFLDADDYLYPQAAAQVAHAWSPGISKMQYRLHLVDIQGRHIDLYPTADVTLDSGDVIPRLLATGRYETVVTSGNAFSRAALEEVLPVPEEDFRMCADGYLVTVAPFHGPVMSLDEPLGAYRQHGSNAWAAVAEAGVDPLARHLRKSLAHDATKYRALAEKAREMELAVPSASSLGLRDHQHLSARLASLCIDRGLHPHARDSRKPLALRGAFASLEARRPLRRRLMLAAWFLVVGFLPRAMAAQVAAWLLSPRSRPEGMVRFLRAARRFSG
jgi:hypothetical protein